MRLVTAEDRQDAGDMSSPNVKAGGGSASSTAAVDAVAGAISVEETMSCGMGPAHAESARVRTKASDAKARRDMVCVVGLGS